MCSTSDTVIAAMKANESSVSMERSITKKDTTAMAMLPARLFRSFPQSLPAIAAAPSPMPMIITLAMAVPEQMMPRL